MIVAVIGNQQKNGAVRLVQQTGFFNLQAAQAETILENVAERATAACLQSIVRGSEKLKRGILHKKPVGFCWVEYLYNLARSACIDGEDGSGNMTCCLTHKIGNHLSNLFRGNQT